MHDVAIVGAGELGGALTHLLARTDAARTIRLIDEARDVAVGKALDLMQAAPIERSSTRISGHADLIHAAGASVIALADRPSSGEWPVDGALALIRRLRQVASESILVCAGWNSREIVERSARELGVPRAQLIGSAPEALRGAARAIVALAAGGSPGDVALTVLGVPPDHVVVPWEEATIGGFAASRVLDEPTRRRVAARFRALWPPGPLALAAAATVVTTAILGKSRRTFSVFVAPDDSHGQRARATALPVRLGPHGVVSVDLPTLNVRDRVALENAMLV